MARSPASRSGKLFSAAIVPGLLLSVLMMLYLYGLSRIRPSMAPDEAQKVSWRERWQALRDVWAAIVLIVAVLGTIYLGIATPTEASGLGAAGALLVALGYRELDRAKLREIVRSTIVTSSMILLIVAAALLFGHVLMRLQAPQMLIAWVAALAQPDWVILLLILVFLLIVGMFLDIVSIILITTPIVLPVITSLGLDPIWFGVVMIIMCEMAVITPPIGLNPYVIKGVRLRSAARHHHGRLAVRPGGGPGRADPGAASATGPVAAQPYVGRTEGLAAAPGPLSGPPYPWLATETDASLVSMRKVRVSRRYRRTTLSVWALVADRQVLPEMQLEVAAARGEHAAAVERRRPDDVAADDALDVVDGGIAVVAALAQGGVGAGAQQYRVWPVHAGQAQLFEGAGRWPLGNRRRPWQVEPAVDEPSRMPTMLAAL